jgi:hypothetical protein
MVIPSVQQQLHGYRGGHQLLATSATLIREDQDLIDRLSDLSGPLAPGQEFDPYLTTYPLPSGAYYVVARTWQDKAAPRAGCVLTRSLLVPIAYWLGTPSLPFLLDALRPVDKLNASVTALEIVAEDQPLPSVIDARTAELVEALFLETRQPIVMFDIEAADSVIARLLTALWPGMRRQFAACGFALGPRGLEGRLFDFLCAPKSSRPRFSEWPGRKIDESASRTRSSRHRWTGPAAEQIFRSPTPNLSSFDTLGVLQSDMQGDGGALRIALLWNELLEKSKTSPNAALGLLDILASQNTFVAARSLLPILSEAVELSSRDSTVFEHLRFLMTLLGKFSGRPMPLSLLRLIRTSADSVSRQDVSQAFEFLASADSLGRRLPRILCAGLADGIAAAMPSETSVSAFSSLHPETRLKLISASEVLDQRIIRSFLDSPSMAWAKAIRLALEFPAADLRLRAVGRLVSKLDHKDQLPVLQGILNGADWPVIARVIRQLSRGCELKVSEFDDPILRAAVHAHAMQSLREEICDLSEAVTTDRLLIKTLELGAADLDWLLASETLRASRKMRVLSALVSECDDYDLGRVFANTRLKASALQLLSGSGVAESVPVGRILVATGIASQEEFEIGLEVLDRVGDPFLQRGLARLLLKSLFAHSAWGGRRSASELVGNLGVQLEGTEIIADATDQALSAPQLNVNIGLLNAAPQSVRSTVLERVDQLSERIIDFRKPFFDLNATMAWAGLIADASELSRRAQLRAAEVVLPFALNMKSGPASPLIIATFPLVHAELARGNAAPNLFSFFYFGDYWDRCDVLRRGLVDAFMHSEWPPADLLVAAHAANVAYEVIDLVSSRYGGSDYQKGILKDLKRLPEDLRDVLRNAMQHHGRNHFRRL